MPTSPQLGQAADVLEPLFSASCVGISGRMLGAWPVRASSAGKHGY